MISGGMKPEDIIKAYHASAMKVGALILFALAAAISVGAKGIGFLIRTLQNLPVF